MGNICLSRDENDASKEDAEACGSCVKLRNEILQRLADEGRFRTECAQRFAEACSRSGSEDGTITKQLWKEMTYAYADRLMSGTAWRRERLYQEVDRDLDEKGGVGYSSQPGGGPMITEALFEELTKILLKHAELDLAERISKFQEKLNTGPGEAAYWSARRDKRTSEPAKVEKIDKKELQFKGASPAASPMQMQGRQLQDGGGGGGSAQTQPFRGSTVPATTPNLGQRSPDAPAAHWPLSHQNLRRLQQEQEEHLREEQEQLQRLQRLQQDQEDKMQAWQQKSQQQHRLLGSNGSPPQQQASPAATPTPPAPDADLEAMKRAVLCGELFVQVYNQQLQKEVKRLGLNPNSRKISLLRDDGMCDDSWDVSSLRCIVRGINTGILADPPPRDQAAAFRFCVSEDDTEDQDLFLCVIFESTGAATLATQAFSELCGATIVSGED